MRFWAVVLCSVLCLAPVSAQDVGSIISRYLFNQILKHSNDSNCPAKGFYTYDAFITAVKSFTGFGTTGDVNTRKREIAAFFGQTSHETTGGWASAPDGPFAWGYCFKEEQGSSDRYRGRGPFQLTHDYNYNQAGKAIGVDLLNKPYLVATDPVISFKTAIWFWMTPQSPTPSSHDVMIGRWTPSEADTAAGRVPGYGVVTNIINGGIECGEGSNARMQDRIGFFKRYCDILGVSPGINLDCANQIPFAEGNNRLGGDAYTWGSAARYSQRYVVKPESQELAMCSQEKLLWSTPDEA